MTFEVILEFMKKFVFIMQIFIYRYDQITI